MVSVLRARPCRGIRGGRFEGARARRGVKVGVERVEGWRACASGTSRWELEKAHVIDGGLRARARREIEGRGLKACA